MSPQVRCRGRVVGRPAPSRYWYFGPISTASGVAGRGLAELPYLCGTQFVDGLVDQVSGLIVVIGLEVGPDLVDQLGVRDAASDAIADTVAIAQCRVGVGKVVSRPDVNVDQVGHRVSGGPRRRHERRGEECRGHRDAAGQSLHRTSVCAGLMLWSSIRR